MKNIRLLIVAVLVVLLLSACGDPGDSGIQTTAGQNTPVQTTAVQTQSSQVPTETTEEPTEEPTVAPTVPVEPVVENPLTDDRYEITELCTITDAVFDAFSFYSPAVRVNKDGVSTDYLFSYTGELLIEEGCQKYEYYGDGVTLMLGDAYGMRFVNIFTGERYLDDPAIRNIKELSDRFFYVIYDSYGMVYDLEKQVFLDGLKVTELTNSTIPVAVGTTVFERVDYGTYRAYLEDGTVTDELDEMSFTATGFLREEGSDVLVYDSNCNLITTVKNAKPVSDYAAGSSGCSDKYFRTGEYKSYTLVDINGNVIIPGPLDSVSARADYIIVRNSQEQYALYLGDGTQLLDYEYDGFTYREDRNLFSMTHLATGQKHYYIPGLGALDVSECEAYDFTVNSADDYLIYGTGEFVTLPGAKELIHALLVNCEAGLVDVFSGNVLVEPGYDYVNATEEHLYVRHGNVWTVYRLELVH